MSYVPTEGEKVCRACGTQKPVTDFRVFRAYGSPDREYRRSWCMDCERDYGRRWRRRNPGYHAERSKAYRTMQP